MHNKQHIIAALAPKIYWSNPGRNQPDLALKASGLHSKACSRRSRPSENQLCKWRRQHHRVSQPPASTRHSPPSLSRTRSQLVRPTTRSTGRDGSPTTRTVLVCPTRVNSSDYMAKSRVIKFARSCNASGHAVNSSSTIDTFVNNYMFDGAQASIIKELSPNFHVQHQFSLGSQVMPPMYNFMSGYMTERVRLHCHGRKKGGMDSSKNLELIVFAHC